MMSRQVTFTEAICAIQDILRSDASPAEIVESTVPYTLSLEEASRIGEAPQDFWAWGTVTLPASIVSEDLEVIANLIRLHTSLREQGENTPVEAYEALRQVLLNASTECSWVEQAFGQRYLCEQVERLKDPSADVEEVLSAIYEATEPSHPTAGQLSRSVFVRLAGTYPEHPIMVLIAKNVMEAGYLEER